MKQITFKYLVAIATATFSLTSCTVIGGKSPENTAKEFLNAYLSTDFNKASSFCTEKLSGELKEAVKEIENLDPSIKNHILLSTQRCTPEIASTKKTESGDTILVSYSIIEQAADSTASPGSNLVKSSLSLIKDPTGEWKVAKLNK